MKNRSAVNLRDKENENTYMEIARDPNEKLNLSTNEEKFEPKLWNKENQLNILKNSSSKKSQFRTKSVKTK